MRVALAVDASSASSVAEIVASLPLSLTPSDGAPQIAAIQGSAGWATRAQEALDAGALAAVVSSPSGHDGAARLSAEASGRVAIAWEFAANPGVQVAADAAAGLRGQAVVAECTVTVPESAGLETAILDALTATGRIVGGFAPVTVLLSGPDGHHLSSRLDNGAPLSVGILVSKAGPASLRVRLLTPEGGLTAVVPSAATAAPAEVRVVRPDGELLLPTLWETSHRATWRRAVEMASGSTASGDIAELHHIAPLAPQPADWSASA